MTKKEFSKKIEALEQTKSSAYALYIKETKRLRDQYTTENCKLKVGDVVSLDGKHGVIESIDVSCVGLFFGRWRRLHKDGRPFSTSYYFGFDEYCKMKIEK